MSRKKVRREAMIVPGRFKAAKVVNGNIEAALRFFKRQVKESNVLQEVRDRQYHIKPNTIKNEKNQQIKRRKKLDAKRAANKGYRRV